MPVSPFKINHKGKSIKVIPFNPLENGLQHVYKHFLNPDEKWNMYYANILDKKKELDDLECRGEDHGTLCPDFQKCHSILNNLYPLYFRLIKEAIKEGASPKEPFHTHNEEFGKHGQKIQTQYFVGHTGILAITHSIKANSEVKSGFRPIRGRCNTEIDFLESTIIGYIIEEKHYKLKQVKNWCGLEWVKWRFKRKP